MASRFDGNDLIVDASKQQVSDAPRIDDDGHLSEQEEAEIYRYYGISNGWTNGYAAGEQMTGTVGQEMTGTVGRDTSGPSTDDAMTRSEEHLVAGTQSVEAGRARLLNHVMTETQQPDVPGERKNVRQGTPLRGRYPPSGTTRRGPSPA